MSADTSSSSSSPRGKRLDLKEDYIDTAWKQRWMGASAKYPEDLIDNVGKVRGLFASADAPSLEDCVFIVCRTDPPEVEAGEAGVVEVYPTVTAANEHVLLLFAKDYGDRMNEECSWSMKGTVPGRDELPGTTHITWSFTHHACLSLEITLAEDPSARPRKVFIVEKWIETSPSEQLVKRVLG